MSILALPFISSASVIAAAALGADKAMSLIVVAFGSAAMAVALSCAAAVL